MSSPQIEFIFENGLSIYREFLANVSSLFSRHSSLLPSINRLSLHWLSSEVVSSFKGEPTIITGSRSDNFLPLLSITALFVEFNTFTGMLSYLWGIIDREIYSPLLTFRDFVASFTCCWGQSAWTLSNVSFNNKVVSLDLGIITFSCATISVTRQRWIL